MGAYGLVRVYLPSLDVSSFLSCPEIVTSHSSISGSTELSTAKDITTQIVSTRARSRLSLQKRSSAHRFAHARLYFTREIPFGNLPASPFLGKYAGVHGGGPSLRISSVAESSRTRLWTAEIFRDAIASSETRFFRNFLCVV